jgi:hypothetical protein
LTKSAFCKAVVTGRWVTRLIRMGNGKYRDATIHETWLLIGGDKTGDRRFSGHCLSANWRAMWRSSRRTDHATHHTGETPLSQRRAQDHSVPE